MCCFAAGVFCAIVSHPADTIVSKLNQQKGSSFITIGKNLGFWGKQCCKYNHELHTNYYIESLRFWLDSSY